MFSFLSIPKYFVFLSCLFLIGCSSSLQVPNSHQDTDRELVDSSLEIIGTTGELRISPYGIEKKFTDWITKTDYVLQMWYYRITFKQVESILKSLSSLGVDISWIGELYPFEGKDKKFLELKSRLESFGIDVKDDSHLDINYNHTKVLLADKKRYMIGTANLTYTSFWKNREYRVVGADPRVAESLVYLFEQDWDGERIDSNRVFSSLLVCPLFCREKLSTFIDSTKKSLSIQAQYIQDEQVVAQLKNLVERGIDLQILVGSNQDDGWLDSFSDGIVRYQQDPYNHAKALLRDQDMLLIGSMNLSKNSLDNNREIGIFLTNDESIQSFTRQFQEDRNTAPDTNTRKD